jgi:hypothetical protein
MKKVQQKQQQNKCNLSKCQIKNITKRTHITLGC